jgi:hypothetical protein
MTWLDANDFAEAMHHKPKLLLAQYEHGHHVGPYSKDMNETDEAEWDKKFIFNKGTQYGIKLCIDALRELIRGEVK